MSYSIIDDFSDEVLDACKDVFGFTREQIVGRSREEPLASVRAIVCNAMLQRGGSSYLVAKILNRNKDTIRYHKREHSIRLVTDRGYREAWCAFSSKIDLTLYENPVQSY